MTFQESIRIIAKTNELTEKVDKAFNIAEQAKKESIDVTRVQVAQTGDGSKDATVGNNASGDTSTGTGAGGEVVQPPLAPPETPNNDPATTTTQSNSASEHITQNGTSQTGTFTSNDQSDKATETGNSGGGDGTSRTESKEQADPANSGDADWTAKSDALIAQGHAVGSETYENARRQHFTKEKGKHEVSDVYNGDAGPKMPTNGWIVYPGGNDFGNNNHGQIAETLNAVVGVDPDDNTKAIELRLDGKSVIPTIPEQEAAGQEPGFAIWSPDGGLEIDDPDYVTGMVWDAGILGSESCALGFNFDTWREAQAALDACKGTPSFRWFLYNDTGSLDGCSPRYEYRGYVALTGGSPAYSVRGYYCTGTGCDASATLPGCSSLPADTPKIPIPTSWPTVGLYVLNMAGVNVTFSPFDSEVPTKLQAGKSYVDIQSAITGDTYRVEKAINGGTMLHNVTNPDYFLYYGSDRTLQAIEPIAHIKFYSPRTY